MVIEMLVLAVRQSSEIHGVSRDQVDHKMILYKDDVNFFFLQHPIAESFVALSKIITLFASASGYKINEQKINSKRFGYIQ